MCMQRVDIYLKGRQILALKELSKKTEISVAEHIRRAVDKYLGAQPKG